MRLSEKQLQAMEYIAQGDRPPFKRTTAESLARHNLAEHTSVGWRLTEFGRTILEQQYPPFGKRDRLFPLQSSETRVADLCPNCESTKHARCCSWCGKVHKPARLYNAQCSAKCESAAAKADKLSDAMEEDYEAHR